MLCTKCNFFVITWHSCSWWLHVNDWLWLCVIINKQSFGLPCGIMFMLGVCPAQQVLWLACFFRFCFSQFVKSSNASRSTNKKSNRENKIPVCFFSFPQKNNKRSKRRSFTWSRRLKGARRNSLSGPDEMHDSEVGWTTDVWRAERTNKIWKYYYYKYLYYYLHQWINKIDFLLKR